MSVAWEPTSTRMTADGPDAPWNKLDATPEEIAREERQEALSKLADEVDQLASTASDYSDVAPEAERCLNLAWWFLMDALREEIGSIPAGARYEFERLKPMARALRARL